MTNKILASTANVYYNNVVQYTVPAGKSAVISKAVVFGSGGNTPVGDNFVIQAYCYANGVATTLFRGKLALNETFELTGGVTLQENDVLTVICDVSNDGFSIDVTIFGAEL